MSTIQDTLTGIQNNTTKVNAENSKDKVGSDAIDQDAFLQLLMAQLKNQDPTNPMDNSQFISQTAQFTQISELQKMNQTNSINQANNMIGKKVSFADPEDSEKTVTGIVSDVIATSKGSKLVINDKPYNLSDVIKGDQELKISYPTLEDYTETDSTDSGSGDSTSVSTET